MPQDNPDPQHWDVLSSNYVSRKPWLTLRQDHVRLPNGAIIEEYNILEYPDLGEHRRRHHRWHDRPRATVPPRHPGRALRTPRRGLRSDGFRPRADGQARTAGGDRLRRRRLVPVVVAARRIPVTRSEDRDLDLSVLNGASRMKEQQLEATEELRVHLSSPLTTSIASSPRAESCRPCMPHRFGSSCTRDVDEGSADILRHAAKLDELQLVAHGLLGFHGECLNVPPRVPHPDQRAYDRRLGRLPATPCPSPTDTPPLYRKLPIEESMPHVMSWSRGESTPCAGRGEAGRRLENAEELWAGLLSVTAKKISAFS